MELHVACDVCGHRYVLSSNHFGRRMKCKSCGVGFDVQSQNYYDPETEETSEENEDADEGSSLSPVWDIARKVGHSIVAICTLTLLIAMASLMFRSPSEAAAEANAARTANGGNSNSVQNGNPSRKQPWKPGQPIPQFQPQVPQPQIPLPNAHQQPMQPHQQPIVPPQFNPPMSQPQVTPHMQQRPARRPAQPDGSMGWPK